MNDNKFPFCEANIKKLPISNDNKILLPEEIRNNDSLAIMFYTSPNTQSFDIILSLYSMSMLNRYGWSDTVMALWSLISLGFSLPILSLITRESNINNNNNNNDNNSHPVRDALDKALTDIVEIVNSARNIVNRPQNLDNILQEQNYTKRYANYVTYGLLALYYVIANHAVNVTDYHKLTAFPSFILDHCFEDMNSHKYDAKGSGRVFTEVKILFKQELLRNIDNVIVNNFMTYLLPAVYYVTNTNINVFDAISPSKLSQYMTLTTMLNTNDSITILKSFVSNDFENPSEFNDNLNNLWRDFRQIDQINNVWSWELEDNPNAEQKEYANIGENLVHRNIIEFSTFMRYIERFQTPSTIDQDIQLIIFVNKEENQELSVSRKNLMSYVGIFFKSTVERICHNNTIEVHQLVSNKLVHVSIARNICMQYAETMWMVFCDAGDLCLSVYGIFERLKVFNNKYRQDKSKLPLSLIMCFSTMEIGFIQISACVLRSIHNCIWNRLTFYMNGYTFNPYLNDSDALVYDCLLSGNDGVDDSTLRQFDYKSSYGTPNMRRLDWKYNGDNYSRISCLSYRFLIQWMHDNSDNKNKIKPDTTFQQKLRSYEHYKDAITDAELQQNYPHIDGVQTVSVSQLVDHAFVPKRNAATFFNTVRCNRNAFIRDGCEGLDETKYTAYQIGDWNSTREYGKLYGSDRNSVLRFFYFMLMTMSVIVITIIVLLITCVNNDKPRINRRI